MSVNTLSTPTRNSISSPSSNRLNSSTSSPIASTSRMSISIQGSDKKKKARELLRDYYKLSNSNNNSPILEKEINPLDIDAPRGFNPTLYFEELSSKSSLPELLKRENELLTEIRELDGERQSLVYNHHHELIEASDTIKKMKSRALALDASLDSLKTSFESISQLSASLSSSRPPFSPSILTPDRSTTPPPSVNTSNNSQTTPTPASVKQFNSLNPTSTSTPSISFSPLLHLPPLLSLPLLLSKSFSQGKVKEAASLWGEWEPILKVWEDENIQGVKEISRECREVLKTRRASIGERT